MRTTTVAIFALVVAAVYADQCDRRKCPDIHINCCLLIIPCRGICNGANGAIRDDSEIIIDQASRVNVVTNTTNTKHGPNTILDTDNHAQHNENIVANLTTNENTKNQQLIHNEVGPNKRVDVGGNAFLGLHVDKTRNNKSSSSGGVGVGIVCVVGAVC